MIDEDFLTSQMFNDTKSGFKHQVPISTSFKVAKHFNFSVGGNYEDTWCLKLLRKRF